jgi:hypothetical protein
MPQTTEQGSEKREIPSLCLRASIAPDTVNVDARTVDVIWTTGAKVLRGFWEQFYEELSLDAKHVRMDRLNNGAPFLDAHNGYSLSAVMGVVVPGTAKLEGKRGTATVRFAKAEDDEEADKVWRKIVDGIIQNVSVGYRVYRYETIEETDKKIPTRRATDWEPYEISAVPMGADDGAGFRSAEKRTSNLCELIRRSAQETDPMPDPVANPPAVDDATRAAAAANAATDAERTRITSIRLAIRVAQKAGLTTERGDSIEAEAVEKKTPITEVRALLLEELSKRDDGLTGAGGPNRIEPGEDQTDKFQRGASAWLFQRAGIAGVIAQAQKQHPNHEAFRNLSTDPGEFRGLTLRDLAVHCLQRAGVKTAGLPNLEIIGRALNFRAGGGMNSTSDFALLLENVMHKTVLTSYMITPDTWSRFCGTKSATDFRDQNHYRLGSFGALDSLNEHGEFKNKSIPDAERVKTKVTTKGNIIALSRQAMVNDDMGAVIETAQGFGRSSKLTVEVAVYALLAQNAGLGPTQADGQPFFHSNRKNVSTSAAISVTAIDADRVQMGKQRDPSNNEYLDLRPAILLVPLEIGGTARVINVNEYDTKDSSFQVANKVRGLFRDVVDSARMSDISATRRYLFSDPNTWPAITVSWLDGKNEPFLESTEGWRVDGMEWKLRTDFGVNEFDARAAVTNAGT